jgi:hypothetical protein
MFSISPFVGSQILKVTPIYKNFKKRIFNVIKDGEGIRSKSEAVNFFAKKLRGV